jgi:hypothetical protein
MQADKIFNKYDFKDDHSHSSCLSQIKTVQMLNSTSTSVLKKLLLKKPNVPAINRDTAFHCICNLARNGSCICIH